MASVYNIDVPKKTGSVQAYKDALTKRLDHIEQIGFNTIFFQVRPMNDAFYPSELAPWSRYITGVENGNPGFDVLRFVIDEAHKRNIELHAWLNPYRVATSVSQFNDLVPENFGKKRSDLVLNINGAHILDPGQPEVQTYIRDVIGELMNNYKDIDGIHFDDYFYIQTISTEDNATYNQYKTAGQSKDNFRRESVNKVIKGVYEDVEEFNSANNKTVKFGIAPTGIWENNGAHGSKTAGQQHNKALYADSRRWVKEGWLHYIMPQLYWPFDKYNQSGNPVAPFATLVDWWSDTVRGTGVDLIIGQGLYRYTSTVDWFHPDELGQQLRYIQTKPEIIGVSIYRYSSFLTTPGSSSETGRNMLANATKDLQENYWNEKVPTPW